jgi:hypothetical protein
MSQSKHIRFEPLDYGDLDKGRKTYQWEVISHREVRLGVIEWYSPWRQYCFNPEPDTVWSSDCIEAVADFIHAHEYDRRDEE